MARVVHVPVPVAGTRSLARSAARTSRLCRGDEGVSLGATPCRVGLAWTSAGDRVHLRGMVGARAVAGIEGTGSADEGGEGQAPWLAPSLVNSAPARLVLSLVAAAGVAQGANIAGVQALGAAHVMLFATFFGATMWTTFVAGILMFKNLPRRTFGKLQAKLFPAYFLLASACLLGTLVTACLLPGVWSGCPTAFFRVGHPVNNLAAGVALSLLNYLVLEPKATEVMLSRHAMQDAGVASGDDAMKALGAKFGKLHGASSMANLGALCAGVGHAVWVASKLAF